MVSLIGWLIGNAESISGLNAAIDLENLGQPLVNHPEQWQRFEDLPGRIYPDQSSS